MSAAGVILATAVVVANPPNSFLTFVIRASLWLVAGVLLMRTFETARGAPANSWALVAYLPLGCASVALEFAEVLAPHAVRSGSLDGFFDAAASLLGLLFVAMVVEARQLAPYDKWLRAMRGWWAMFIILGILYALAGLTPTHSTETLRQDYAWVWAGLAGAVASLAVVMWREPQTQHSPRIQRSSRDVPINSTPTKPRADRAETATRTPGRSTKA
jgi:hypothetical protein